MQLVDSYVVAAMTKSVQLGNERAGKKGTCRKKIIYIRINRGWECGLGLGGIRPIVLILLLHTRLRFLGFVVNGNGLGSHDFEEFFANLAGAFDFAQFCSEMFDIGLHSVYTVSIVHERDSSVQTNLFFPASVCTSASWKAFVH